MALDPSLITDVMSRWQGPQLPDPIERMAKLQALRSGVLQQQAAQQNLQTGALEQQQRQLALAQAQRDNQDAQTLQAAFQNPDTAKTIASWDGKSPFPVQGLQWKTQQAMGDKVLADQQKALAMSQEQMKASDAKHAHIAGALEGLAYNADGTPRADADVARDAPATFQGLMDKGYIPQGTPMPPINGGADIQKYAAANNFQQELNQYAQGAQKTAQDIETSKSTATKNLAQGEQAKGAAEKDRIAKVNAALAAAAAVAPGDQAGLENARKAVITSGATPEEAGRVPMTADKAALDTLRRSLLTGEQQTTADQAQANAAQQKKYEDAQQANANARLGLERQRVGAEIGSQAGNQALINVPLNMRNAATGDALKAGNEYATAMHSADEMNALIGLARAGNKLAYSYAPTTGVLTINSANGSKRINLNEVNAYGGAGSDYDRLAGWFGKHLTGASIDSSILDSMQQVHGAMLNAATDLYGRKLQIVNNTYKSDFAPVNFAPADGAQPGAAQPGGAPSPGGAPGGVPGGVLPRQAGAPLPAGGGRVMDKATAQKFYDAARGDPAKARALAAQYNWKLQ
jgi:hypothetical protein